MSEVIYGTVDTELWFEDLPLYEQVIDLFEEIKNKYGDQLSLSEFLRGYNCFVQRHDIDALVALGEHSQVIKPFFELYRLYAKRKTIDEALLVSTLSQTIFTNRLCKAIKQSYGEISISDLRNKIAKEIGQMDLRRTYDSNKSYKAFKGNGVGGAVQLAVAFILAE